MPVRDILRFSVVLLISSSFHKCVECALIIKPQDVVAVVGEVVTLNCSSSVSKRGNIAWSVFDSRNYIFARNELSSDVASYITVSDRDDGNCSLTINASLTAANRYICRELDSENKASAELIVMENLARCTREIKNLSLSISCSMVSAGKWAPTVLCEQVNEGKDDRLLQANEITKLDNGSNVVTSTWNFISKNDSCNAKITCRTGFKHHGRSNETIATYCPPCSFEKQGFPSRRRFISIDVSELWSDPSYNGCSNLTCGDLLQSYDNALYTLSIICYVVSEAALFFTILSYGITWKLFNPAQEVFLFNLCGALTMAYTICMAGINSQGDFKDGCKDIVLQLQYCILVAFCILLAEGVSLLRYIISDFQDRRTGEIIFLLVVSWGLPIIIVGLSYGFTKVDGDGYGLVCWLMLDRSYIWALAIPVLTFIGANVAISITVLLYMYWKISLLPKIAKKRKLIRATLWNMFVTCPVLSLGCLFGVLSSVYNSVLLLHLFFLINSLQGLLIFLFHVPRNIKKIITICSCTSKLGHSGDNQTTLTKLSFLAHYVFGPMSGERQPPSVEASDKLESIH